MSVEIRVYIDTGVVLSYEVGSVEKAREHAASIISGGYRSTREGTDELVWWPPHRVLKVTASGAGESTQYKDTARAT